MGGNPVGFIDYLGLYSCRCILGDRSSTSGGGVTVKKPRIRDGHEVKYFYYHCDCKCKDGRNQSFRRLGGSDAGHNGNQFAHGVSNYLEDQTNTQGQMSTNWTGGADYFNVDTEEWFFPDHDRDYLRASITDEMNRRCYACQSGAK